MILSLKRFCFGGKKNKTVEEKKMKSEYFLCVLALFPVLASTTTNTELCQLHPCSCSENYHDADLTDVHCKCSNLESFKIGPSDSGAHSLPENAAQLIVEDCGDVDLLSRALNSHPNLKNVTLTKVQRVTLHSNLFESRSGQDETSKNVQNIELSAIRHLEVSRHAFDGLSVTGSFLLKDVVMRTVVSLAFGFDYVNEFSIFGSLFDRTSMWGFKLTKCGEFNILGGSRFYSLASHAFHMHCNKFMLAYNIFDSLQDASMSVKYGFADIQGNAFEKITGKPFVDLKPMTSLDNSSHPSLSGFVFRENKFSLDPILPFNALAMPGFADVNSDQSYVDIEANHFLCDCDKMGWMLAALQNNFDEDVIRSSSGQGTLDFMQQLYGSSGFCLKCGFRSCEPTEERVVDFGASALNEWTSDSGFYSCSVSGQVIKSQGSIMPADKKSPETTESPRTTRPPRTEPRPKNPESGTLNTLGIGTTRKSDENRGEEEDLAELKNSELNESNKNYLNLYFLLSSILIGLIF